LGVNALLQEACASKARHVVPGPGGNSGGQRLFACLYGGSVHGDPYGNIGNGLWLTGLPVFSQLSGRRVWMAGVFTRGPKTRMARGSRMCSSMNKRADEISGIVQ
jgi:hypothetical protein